MVFQEYPGKRLAARSHWRRHTRETWREKESARERGRCAVAVHAGRSGCPGSRHPALSNRADGRRGEKVSGAPLATRRTTPSPRRSGPFFFFKQKTAYEILA